jgi:hypothetical protein
MRLHFGHLRSWGQTSPPIYHLISLEGWNDRIPIYLPISIICTWSADTCWHILEGQVSMAQLQTWDPPPILEETHLLVLFLSKLFPTRCKDVLIKHCGIRQD